MENKKYELLDVSLNAMNQGAFNLLITRGDSGMGKTHKILNFVKNKNLEYTYIKTYSTPLKFYELLYLNRDKKVIIFDDLSNLGDSKILGMLKSACWSVLGEDREVNYHTTSRLFERLNIPEKFKMKASVILIFNEVLSGFEPIISRGVNIDFDFSFHEKLAIFKGLKETKEIDEEIINYVKESCSEATRNLSIRSLVILSSIKKRGFEWKIFAKEMFKIDEEIQMLLSLVSKYSKLEDACNEWKIQTGKSRSTFMRLLKGIRKSKK